MPVLLDGILVLDVIESQLAWQVKPQGVHYWMSMYALAATDQIDSGFALSARVEANGVLSHCKENLYQRFRTLFEACRALSVFDAASLAH